MSRDTLNQKTNLLSVLNTFILLANSFLEEGPEWLNEYTYSLFKLLWVKKKTKTDDLDNIELDGYDFKMKNRGTFLHRKSEGLFL
jgi:hypothetical protein